MFIRMTRIQKALLALLRISMGWLFFYAGITKVLNPEWSAAGYIKSAKTFNAFYMWLAQPDVLPYVNWLNKWGLTLIGVCLILGIFVRISSILGAALMALYYFVVLQFPYPNANSYIVDQHIIYLLVLLFLAAASAGRYFGLENWCRNLPVCKRWPKVRSLFG